MKAKLIPALFFCAAGVVACDGNNEDKDTTVRPDTTDTLGGDTTDTVDATDTSTPIDTVVPPDTVQQTGSVKAAQVEAEQVTCNPASIVDVNPQGTLTGVVVTTPKFDASPSGQEKTFDGYYVADLDGGAYSGIVVRIPAAMRPATDLVPGDVVDLTGQLKEAFCMTQLDVATITIKTPVTPIAPAAVAGADFAQEAYEGMLVKLSGVTVTKASEAGGWKFSPGDGEIGFSFADYISFNDGAVYDITGVVRYAFSKWQVVPRYKTDIVRISGGTTTPITDLQGAAISTTCPSPAPQFQNGVRGVDIQGIVVAGRYDVTASLHGYIVADGTQAPYSSIIVTVPAASATNFVPGDEVRATGDHQEFYCLTQFRSSTIEKVGGPAPIPTPATLAKNSPDLEKFEGMLVELTDVNVTGDDGHGAATTDAGVLIDKTLMGAGFSKPASGTKLSSLKGVVVYSFDAFRVSPRSAEDMVVAPN
ncbi:MAG: hypothetical protein JNJ59_25545 [Deltaproteobacteria bacterium]|nr:hypothetical protein [Deltaproteobacteria bacterium]